MKQKVVIKVSMNGQKCQSKALKIVVGVQGVEAAALQGQDKNQIEVTGESMDVILLTTSLRKSVGYAELVSVTTVGGGGGGKPSDGGKPSSGGKPSDGGKPSGGKPNEPPPPIVWPPPPVVWPPYNYPPYGYWEYPVREYDNYCSIL